MTTLLLIYDEIIGFAIILRGALREERKQSCGIPPL
jgi:hypothetical protein